MNEKVNYSIDKGLIFMLAGLAGCKQKEVWAHLADATRVYTDRIEKKGTRESWRWFTFPETDIKMKVKVGKRGGTHRNYSTGKEVVKPTYYVANIKLDRNGMEEFTSDQVEAFLIEEVLLGDDE